MWSYSSKWTTKLLVKHWNDIFAHIEGGCEGVSVTKWKAAINATKDQCDKMPRKQVIKSLSELDCKYRWNTSSIS